ncbi:ABC-F family ATP-binding cassette domain-containing protein [Acidipropionibacterium virtanenii]|uniref:Energy-dependent translational throttle protein EttA n=1 Tax=Acidipropionibacterium virtanenii TaxID=2057246 RepID=A0A344UVG7_9ACTN|nr:ABC-F family ATP-binding cassette domain-containing protein [Acidipropionibacterium virtanenii]AXE39265.1 Energy-dependent translational throttle protein EttA [Acidipropionibacterium virtanenii]
MAASINILNAEHVTKTFGTRVVLDDLSLGLSSGEVIGVVGRNGDGKSTLLGILTGTVEPDAGSVTRTGSVSIGLLAQAETPVPGQTVRDLVVQGRPDHVWASDPAARPIVEQMLADIDLDSATSELSGGERRRAALVALMLGDHDLLVLDEPTNHLDVEAVAWLAGHLRALRAHGVAMLIVSHDRWFLDEVCNRVWEVHDATVDAYDGGYAAYTLARAERSRQAAANEARRRNLVRKELAWLRRGAPARTSKPRFRIDAANALIADVPDPRDKLELARFSASRLGKDVFDLDDVTLTLPDGRSLLKHLTWSIGPGDRIGLVGVNGAGKSTLLNLLDQLIEPTSGRVKQGKTLHIAHLTQEVHELDADRPEGRETVLDSVQRLRQETTLATGRETGAGNLLEDFGFTGQRLVTRVGDLSGGEKRRLQLLRLLIEEPNVLLLDEPTNDLDIDTLRVVEDYLDTWPGTLIVVTHDRYFLERVCDVTYALMGDGSCVLLPGGIDQYLEAREHREAGPSKSQQVGSSADPSAPGPSSARLRRARKDMARLEGQISRARHDLDGIHEEMARVATDFVKLNELQQDASRLETRIDDLENAWLEAGELIEEA